MSGQEKKLNPEKVKLFLSLFSPSEEERLKQEFGKLDTSARARFGLGRATAADSSYLERVGVLKQPTPEQQLKTQQAQNLLNLAAKPTRADSVQYDMLHPGKKSIFSPEKEYDPKQAYHDRYWGLAIKARDGKASKEEIAELAKMHERIYRDTKSRESLGKKRERYEKKLKWAEDVLSATRDIKKGYKTIKEPKYSEEFRDIAKQTKKMYADSVFYLNESERLRSQGIDISSGELSEKVEQGVAIKDQILQQYKSGELQKLLPQMTPEGLRRHLEQYIDEQLQPLGIDLEDIDYFTRRGK